MKLAKREVLKVNLLERSQLLTFTLILDEDYFEGFDLHLKSLPATSDEEFWKFVDFILQVLRFKCWQRAGFFLEPVTFEYEKMVSMEEHGKFEREIGQ